MAGAGYKLFNTGDVLTAAQVNTYLMEQSVMVFANAAARTTALSGVVAEGMLSYLKDTDAVEVYNGSAWVASDDPNAIQNSIVDAKGDLIVATAADTVSRLAVGANDTVLTADSSTASGLKWAAPASTSITLSDYTATYTNFTLGNGTAITKWYDASSTMFYLYIAITLGSTSSITSFFRVSLPATIAQDAGNSIGYQLTIGKFSDISGGKDYELSVYGSTSTTLQLGLQDTGGTYNSFGGNKVDATSPVAFGTGDQIFIQGWFRKAQS